MNSYLGYRRTLFVVALSTCGCLPRLHVDIEIEEENEEKNGDDAAGGTSSVLATTVASSGGTPTTASYAARDPESSRASTARAGASNSFGQGGGYSPIAPEHSGGTTAARSNGDFGATGGRTMASHPALRAGNGGTSESGGGTASFSADQTAGTAGAGTSMQVGDSLSAAGSHAKSPCTRSTERWPPDKDLRLCWSDSATGAELEEFRTLSRDWISSEIVEHFGLVVSGWAVCSQTTAQEYVSLDVDPAAEISQVCGSEAPFSTTTRIVFGKDATLGPQMKGVVLRTFLQALGFRAPDPASEAADDCTRSGTYEMLDGYSILNYGRCWSADFDSVTNGNPSRAARLSPWDIVHLQNAYGRKPVGSVVGIGDRCLTFPESSLAPNLKQAIVSTCRGTYNQTWSWGMDQALVAREFDPVGKYNRLDIDNANTEDGSRVWNWWNNGTYAQKWWFPEAQLIGMGGLCLELVAPNEDDASRLAECNGSTRQQWILDSANEADKAERGHFRIRSANSDQSADGDCLESSSIDEFLRVSPCADLVEQQLFRFDRGGSLLTYSGKCVGTTEAALGTSAPVRTSTCGSSTDFRSQAAALWAVKSTIRSPIKPTYPEPKCLNVAAAPLSDGTSEVHIWTCEGLRSQSWKYWP